MLMMMLTNVEADVDNDGDVDDDDDGDDDDGEDDDDDGDDDDVDDADDDDSDGDDDVDDDGDDDDADDEKKMMRLMRRRRKMMRLRRRKTDPKTGKHTLCEPAQATCAWTFHKSHYVGKFTRGHCFVRACAVEMHMDRAQEPFYIWKFTGKTTGDTSRDIVLCEPAQWKCTSTLHNSHSVWKFRKKMQKYAPPATNSLWEPAQSKWTSTFHKCHFVWNFTGKTPNAPETTSIKHRALTPTVRTPQCGHTVWEKIEVWHPTKRIACFRWCSFLGITITTTDYWLLHIIYVNYI